MHNLALALHYNHHTVTGSDDEIYNPARDRLDAVGLLPPAEGWFPEKITSELDFVILGMHARQDNPELQVAKAKNIPVYSYPEYLYRHAADKKRVVIAGSHGKTTTTAMVLHVLRELKIDADYLVGAQLEGFERMVRLTDAPLMVIEGDEYLSSPIDRRPKILHYRPHLAVITGIAWDHINVFPTFEEYVKQFRLFIESMPTGAQLFWFEKDEELKRIANVNPELRTASYIGFPARLDEDRVSIQITGGWQPIEVFGQHNLENMRAAYLLCRELGVSDSDFAAAIASFKGAAKRMQRLAETKTSLAMLDFAHAPSKVRATVRAMQERYPERELVACLELHTFSSLNQTFLQEYKQTLVPAQRAYVYYNQHTLEMKRLPPLSPEQVRQAFGSDNVEVITNNQQLVNELQTINWANHNLLLMSSGNFNGLDLKTLASDLLQ